jgi:hypothetical protein
MILLLTTIKKVLKYYELYALIVISHISRYDYRFIFFDCTHEYISYLKRNTVIRHKLVFAFVVHFLLS